jgi:hypothetical protein
LNRAEQFKSKCVFLIKGIVHEKKQSVLKREKKTRKKFQKVLPQLKNNRTLSSQLSIGQIKSPQPQIAQPKFSSTNLLRVNFFCFKHLLYTLDCDAITNIKNTTFGCHVVIHPIHLVISNLARYSSSRYVSDVMTRKKVAPAVFAQPSSECLY